MNILENILSQFIKIPKNIDELTNKQIIEVDEYVALNESTNLVIGHVLTCEKHPNADTLHVTTVDVGSDVLQIVCGANNIAKDQYVIVAKTGAVLPGNFEIKQTTIRGVESNGMICSLKELGFDEKVVPSDLAKGIYYFPDKLKPGSDALKAIGLDGKKLVLGMTTNRGDLLSHLGFAYDLASMLDTKVTIPQTTFKTIAQTNDLKVEILNDTCFKYDAAVLDIKVKESPWWLKNALIQSDIRPINNVVDITNYILITYGTPLHAFDYHKVDSNSIVVRHAKKGEKVVTLDEVERTLESTDILITDGKRPIALGGVMGLLNTVIDDDSTKMILEAAAFDPATIQKTSKRLGLRSDSSLRFERGIDQTRVSIGLNAAIELLVKYADAKVHQGIASAVKSEQTNPWIKLDVKKVNQQLGIELKLDEIKALLSRLNYKIKDEKALTVQAPSYRKDILIPADVLEELARIYGYDNIPHQKLLISENGGLTDVQKKIRKLRHLCRGLGLNEVINYSLLSLDEINDFPVHGQSVHVLTPMSEDRKYLRQSLMQGLLQNVSYHAARQMNDVALFEIGHVFSKDNEKNHLGIIMQGNFIESTWHKNDLVSNFYVLKGLLEQIGRALNKSFEIVKNNEVNALHPGMQGDVYLNGKKIGVIGQVHPLKEMAYDVKKVFVCEIDLSFLAEKDSSLTFDGVSKYPSIKRDISFIINNSYPVADVLKLIQQTAKKMITGVELFDVYQGDKVEAGYQSLAVSITFNNKEKTLEKDEVEKALKSIKNRLNFEFKAVLRD